MPVLLFKASEIYEAGINQMRELSAKIMTLSDLTKTPLTPGETPDMRRHQIAKFGKVMAETFIQMDELMGKIAEATAKHADRVDFDPKPITDDSQSN